MHKSMVGLFCLALTSIVGPWLVPYSYLEIDLAIKNLPPSLTHWFGTDDLGRDLFCRVCLGARLSFSIGCIAVLIDGILGVLWGAVAAYCGGKIDEIMMRICDFLRAIPTLLVAMVSTIFIGVGIQTVLVSLFLMGWINMARITRMQVLQIKEMDYITAARALGAKGPHLIFRHFLPILRKPLLTTALYIVPKALFMEASLSFLGFGIQHPYASWGGMISESMNAIQFYPWRFFFPAGAFVLTIFLFSLSFRLEKH